MTLNFWSLPPPLRFWDYWYVPPCLACTAQGTEPRALDVRKHPTPWAAFPFESFYQWVPVREALLRRQPHSRPTSPISAHSTSFGTRRVPGFIYTWGKSQSLGISYITQIKPQVGSLLGSAEMKFSEVRSWLVTQTIMSLRSCHMKSDSAPAHLSIEFTITSQDYVMWKRDGSNEGSIPFPCPTVGWIGSCKANLSYLFNTSLLFQKPTLSMQPMTRNNIIKYTCFSSKTTWAK